MPIAHLVHLIATVAEVNPTVSMNIFVHKSEALSDEFKVGEWADAFLGVWCFSSRRPLVVLPVPGSGPCPPVPI